MSARYPEVVITSRTQWRRWLEQHGETEPGVWVVTWKKRSDRPHVGYDDLVDEAVAAGWVDSRPRTVDDDRSALLMTPRKPSSRWSARNKTRVDTLRRAGLMRPAGEAAVRVAQQTGTWDALDAVEQLTEPEDLSAALDREPDARRYWDAFPRSTKRSILEWITSAKRDTTRRRRIERTVADAARDVRANQWRQPKAGRQATD